MRLYTRARKKRQHILTAQLEQSLIANKNSIRHYKNIANEANASRYNNTSRSAGDKCSQTARLSSAARRRLSGAVVILINKMARKKIITTTKIHNTTLCGVECARSSEEHCTTTTIKLNAPQHLAQNRIDVFSFYFFQLTMAIPNCSDRQTVQQHLQQRSLVADIQSRCQHRCCLFLCKYFCVHVCMCACIYRCYHCC